MTSKFYLQSCQIQAKDGKSRQLNNFCIEGNICFVFTWVMSVLYIFLLSQELHNLICLTGSLKS